MSRAHLIVAAMMTLTTCVNSFAASGTWNSTGGGNWNESANWSGSLPNAVGDSATFSLGSPAASANVNVDALTIIGSLHIQNASAITLGGSNTLVFDNSLAAADAILDVGTNVTASHLTLSSPLEWFSNTSASVASGSTLNLIGAFSGAGDLTRQGSGLLVIGPNVTGDNSAWTGGLFVNAGTVLIGGSTGNVRALGSTAGATNVAAGATLELSGIAAAGNSINSSTVFSESLTITGSGVSNRGALYYHSNYLAVLTGAITLNGSAEAAIGVEVGGTLHIGDPNGVVAGGSIAGAGTLVKSNGSAMGEGKLQLNVAAGHSGGTRVESGALAIGTRGSLVGTGNVAVDGSGRLEVFEGAGGDAVLNSVSLNSVVLNGGSLSLGVNANPSSFLNSASTGGSILLATNNTNNLNLSGILGGTDDANKIHLGAAGAQRTYSGTISFNSGATYRDVLVGGGDSAALQNLNRLTISSNLLASNHVNGVHVESGILELTGNNTYSGQSIIEDGAELWIQGSGALGTTTGSDVDATIINSGGTLRFAAGGANSGNEKFVLNGGSLNAFGAAVNGPIVVNDSSRIIGGDLFGTISGDGDLTLGGGMFGMELHGNNSITGKAYVGSIGDASVEIHHANALGNASGETIVTGGKLSLFTQVNESIIADAGDIVLRTSTYGGDLILRGGGLRTETTPATVTQTVVLDGGKSKMGGIGSSSGLLTISGGVSGQGDLEIVRDTLFEGPLSYTGDLVVSFGTATLDVESSLNGQLTLLGGELRANEDLTASLRLKNGTLRTAADKTITSLDSEIEIQGARIEANLAGVTTINKISSDTATFTSIGATSTAAILIHEGKALVGQNTGLGSTASSTTVAASTNAVLEFEPGLTVAESIHLNNASGFDHTGALLLSDTAGFPNRTTVLTGQIALGNQSSFIGVSSRGTIQTDGAITGGSLALVGGTSSDPGTLRLNSAGNTYTGVTIIAPDAARYATLSIGANGKLTQSSHVDVHSRGVLEIDTDGATAITDRISNALPVNLMGGTLRLRGDFNSGTTSLETVGPVTLAQGASRIEIASIQSGTTVDMTLTSLSRQPGTTVQFVGLPDPIGVPGFSGHIFVSGGGPALTNGILGGWAIADREGVKIDFATYDAIKGIIALPDAGRPAQVQGASSSANVRTNAALNTLTGDASINSLAIDTGNVSLITPVNLDLGGNTLNLLSGGLLRNGNNQDHTTLIANGNLTAGGNAPNSELVLFISQSTTTISANIADNPGGAVGLTKSGGARLILSGTNTYSGPTVVNESALEINSTSALPVDSNVNIMGGSFSNTSGSILDVGDVILRGNGSIGGINADSYEVHSGFISSLAGNGSFTKVGPGRANLGSDNTAYSGAISVDGGLLTINHLKSLGSGTATIGLDGTLSTSSEQRNYQGSIVLDGGRLSMPHGTSALPITFSGPVAFSADSTIETTNTASLNQLTIDPGLTLAKTGVGTLRLNGLTSVADGSEFLIKAGTLELLQTLVCDSTTDTLKLSGVQELSLGSVAQVILNASGYDGNTDIRYIDAYLRRFDALAAGTTTIYDGGRLIVEANNSEGNIVLAGGEIVIPAGYTFAGSITNSGLVSPGFSPGILAINGDYAQNGDGVLKVEIASPSLLDVTYTQINDAVHASGDMLLDGELNIVLLHDYTPLPGDSFEILRYGSRTGTFETITGRMLGGDLFFDLIYDSDGLTLLATEASAGDADADGDVDLSDLSALAAQYGKNSAASWREGDFDLDGDVDLNDLSSLAAHYGSGAAQAYADFQTLSAVPEPASVGLCIGAIVMGRRRNLRA